MSELADKILAAIGKVEEKAKAATGTLTGAWEVESFNNNGPGALPGSAWVGDGDEGVAMVRGGHRAVHVALHDPQSVLRACEADRELIDDYKDLVHQAENTTSDLLAAVQIKVGLMHWVLSRMAQRYGIWGVVSAPEPSLAELVRAAIEADPAAVDEAAMGTLDTERENAWWRQVDTTPSHHLSYKFWPETGLTTVVCSCGTLVGPEPAKSSPEHMAACNEAITAHAVSVMPPGVMEVLDDLAAQANRRLPEETD